MRKILIVLFAAVSLLSCKNASKAVEEVEQPLTMVGPAFEADSAYRYCKEQCDFGPRTMNSEAHDLCRDWIVKEFKRHGCSVELQNAELMGYDGTMLQATNIIAHYTPTGEALKDVSGTSDPLPRVLLCAHYDSRPWADNDPDEKNHHKPVLAANDGASGVAVMLEVARLLHAADSARVGVDFVCFDAEDYGTPMWYEGESKIDDPWALGAQHWAKLQQDGQETLFATSEEEKEAVSHHSQTKANVNDTINVVRAGEGKISFGILLDMVGGEGAKFYHEGMSLEYARDIVNKVWSAASVAGYSQVFPNTPGGTVTDDHVPVNQIAQIPCIDIIPYYPDCQQSSFGPTWHTVHDTMEHISKATLKAVGQTIIQVLYSEE